MNDTNFSSSWITTRGTPLTEFWKDYLETIDSRLPDEAVAGILEGTRRMIVDFTKSNRDAAEKIAGIEALATRTIPVVTQMLSMSESVFNLLDLFEIRFGSVDESFVIGSDEHARILLGCELPEPGSISRLGAETEVLAALVKEFSMALGSATEPWLRSGEVEEIDFETIKAEDMPLWGRYARLHNGSFLWKAVNPAVVAVHRLVDPTEPNEGVRCFAKLVETGSYQVSEIRR